MKKINGYKLWARYIAEFAVRNTVLEDYHAGVPLPEKYMKGYYSRISDDEMRVFMLQVEKNLADLLRFRDDRWDDPEVTEFLIKHGFGTHGISWDDPTLNEKKG